MNLGKLLNVESDSKTTGHSYQGGKTESQFKKRRKDMNNSEKIAFDREREKVIGMYRKLKGRERYGVRPLK